MRCKSISEFIMCFMLSLFSLTAFAQIKITGTASDAETGEPLSFITIQIKGTTAGTTSDMDGNYLSSTYKCNFLGADNKQ